jgi:hypothetical protein
LATWEWTKGLPAPTSDFFNAFVTLPKRAMMSEFVPVLWICTDVA